MINLPSLLFVLLSIVMFVIHKYAGSKVGKLYSRLKFLEVEKIKDEIEGSSDAMIKIDSIIKEINDRYTHYKIMHDNGKWLSLIFLLMAGMFNAL